MFKNEFIEIDTKLSAVIACCCSPTQKADVACLIHSFMKKYVCCIGDGGNDPSSRCWCVVTTLNLSLHWHVLFQGIRIVSKEGKQASLAADFSIMQFSYLKTSSLARLKFVPMLCQACSVRHTSWTHHFCYASCVLHHLLLCANHPLPRMVDGRIHHHLHHGTETLWRSSIAISWAVQRVDQGLCLTSIIPNITNWQGQALSYKTFFQWLMISLYQGK